MTPKHTTFEITARSIDFGSHVISIRHVVSTGITRGRPFFAFGLALIAAALALIGYDLAAGKAMTALQSGGSTTIWFALLALGFGIFSLVFQRRTLTIALADGGKVRLPAGRDDFMRSVVTRVAEAMNADSNALLHYRIDMAAETVDVLSHAGSPPSQPPIFRGEPAMSSSSSGMPPALDQIPAGPHDTYGPAQLNGAGHHQNTDVAHHSDGFADGAEHWTSNGNHAGNIGRAKPNQIAAPHSVQAGHTGPANGAASPPFNGHSPLPPGRISASVGQPHKSLTPNPKREMDALIAFVLRTDIPHKSALLDLINVVDDHVKGGATSRADAVAHWQSFSSYVDQYLGNVEGLLPLTKRVGRNFAHA